MKAHRLAVLLIVAMFAAACTAEDARDALHAGGKLLYDTMKAAKDAGDNGH